MPFNVSKGYTPLIGMVRKNMNRKEWISFRFMFLRSWRCGESGTTSA
jgi:hypothetical protein